MTQPSKADKPRIGITLGDINGVGPEVTMKALSDNRLLSMITPVVYGSSKVLSFYKKLLNIEELNYSQVRNQGQYLPKSINVVTSWDENLEAHPGKASPQSGKAALQALRQAAADLKDGFTDALVTAPIDKHTVHSDEFPFKGHTEFLAEFFGAKEHLMLLVNESLRVGLVTGHVPLRDVASLITRERVESKLKSLEQTLRKDFGIQKPKIAVLGLNPHAGDGGVIGDEDEKILKPLINDWKNQGKTVFGPHPPDGFFAAGNFLKYDGILAMYHDQGLIPFKSMAFDTGVNFTAGLPVVRTSPDHGTGYSIAGKNQASENSMRQAIYTALDILKARQESSTEK
ncbi:MAG TPA: 4-hydroxythreonine-4-phosphate dehydrogenase PdxA [Cyclobacteriaceae bacterium]